MKDTRLDDDAQLAAMGHKAELKRNFSMLYVETGLLRDFRMKIADRK
jgi:hypothetical protein